MNQDYRVRVDYHRPSGTPTSVTVIVNASSASKARREGLALVKSNPQRKVASVHKTYAVPVAESPFSKTASVGGPERPNLQQVPKVAHTGDVVTIQPAPFVGTIRHWLNGKGVDVVSPTGASKGYTREAFTRLTGLLLEAAPPRTTTSVYSIYPNDACYKQDFGPVRSSSYDLNDLVQIRVVRDADTGKLLSKEFV